MSCLVGPLMCHRKHFVDKFQLKSGRGMDVGFQENRGKKVHIEMANMSLAWSRKSKVTSQTCIEVKEVFFDIAFCAIED
jgi:hypothetical protein